MRTRRALVAFGLILATFALGAALVARAVEQRITREIALQVPGAAVGAVHFHWLSPLRLENVSLDLPSGGRLHADAVDASWTLAGGRDPRRHLGGVALHGIHAARGAVELEAASLAFDVLAWEKDGAGELVRLRQPAGGHVELRRRLAASSTHEVVLALTDLDLSEVSLLWQGERVLAPGTWTGRVAVRTHAADIETEGSLDGRGARVALPSNLGSGHGYGEPTLARLDWDVARTGDALALRRADIRIGRLTLAARGDVALLATDRRADLRIAARGELGSAFAAAGVPLPDALRGAPGEGLGTANFEATVRGPLADPAALEIVPHLQFEVAPRATARLAYLRAPFRYAPPDAPGLTLELHAGAPGFVPLGDVPPLFLRTLLISEDAGFYGHPGIDVAEIPVAFAANLERGGPARGASTITQQLVKNLFLSREKSYSRKLEEAALALLVDAAVPKSRLLEIYLNVIEWGPRLHGVGPASRHYFGKEPDELTPKETAFLVCLIPAPLRYHEAHTAGHVGPGMERLMDNLLAKLRSVDALTDEEYAEALSEELQFAPETAPPAPTLGTSPTIRRTALTH